MPVPPARAARSPRRSDTRAAPRPPFAFGGLRPDRRHQHDGLLRDLRVARVYQGVLHVDLERLVVAAPPRRAAALAAPLPDHFRWHLEARRLRELLQVAQDVSLAEDERGARDL